MLVKMLDKQQKMLLLQYQEQFWDRMIWKSFCKEYLMKINTKL